MTSRLTIEQVRRVVRSEIERALKIKPDSEPRECSPADAAHILCRHRNTIARWIADGRLRVTRQDATGRVLMVELPRAQI